MSERVSIAADGEEAARSALGRCVASGGVAVFPADGLYGLCCDPIRAGAIERVHQLKGRDDGKPSAVMYLSQLVMRELLGEIGPRTAGAMGALMPGPVTLVIDNPGHRYPLACGDDPGRLGVRLIEGPLAGVETPLFQTSANPSGAEAPAAPEQLDPGIAAGADLVIDGGDLSGTPSTVIDLSAIDRSGEWRILRQGGLPAADVERALG